MKYKVYNTEPALTRNNWQLSGEYATLPEALNFAETIADGKLLMTDLEQIERSLNQHSLTIGHWYYRNSMGGLEVSQELKLVKE